MADYSQHPSVIAVASVARLAASEELLKAVGANHLLNLQRQVHEADKVLARQPPGEADWRGQRSEALYGLARECLGLIGAVDEDYSDGTADVAGAARSEDAEDLGWDFGVVIAELAATGLAAFASGLSPEVHVSSVYIERLSLDLDYFSAHLFGGLSRLGASGHLQGREARLLHALQLLCTWSMAAVGRTVGLESLSAPLLWEWACRDALWACVLAKGVLSVGSAQRAAELKSMGPQLPHDLPQLQHTVLGALLGLGSTSVAFATETGESEIGIASGNEDLVRHRAQLAVAMVSCHVPQALFEAAARAGVEATPPLAEFLTSLLQPELADQDFEEASAAAREAMTEVFIGGSTPSAAASVSEARRAAGNLALEISRYTGVLWGLLAEVPATHEAAGRLPAGFLQNCADLAYFVPPPEQGLVPFMANCFGGASFLAADHTALAALCFVAANGGATPGDGGPLVAALASLPPEGKATVAERWSRWRGPVKLEFLAHWALLVEVPEEQATPPMATQPAVPQFALPPPVAQPARGRGTMLQELVHDAPPQFRCAYDGQLMMDPVQSPGQLVFDRSGLAFALANTGGHCPVTGQPLTVEECVRLPELRRQIVKWIREQKPART